MQGQHLWGVLLQLLMSCSLFEFQHVIICIAAHACRWRAQWLFRHCSRA